MRLSFFGCVVVVSVVMCCVTSVVCSVYSKTLRYSMFFEHPTKEEVVAEETRRHQEAEKWAKSIEDGIGNFILHSVQPDDVKDTLSIVMLSSPRQGQASRYATVCLQGLFQNMTYKEATHIKAGMVVRGPVPLLAVASRLHRLIVRKQEPDEESINPSGTVEKEYADYIEALGMCKDFKTKFCLILQDDAYPTQHVVTHILDAIDTEATMWSSMKLFYHEFWMGWSTETTPPFLLFCAAFFLCNLFLWSYVWSNGDDADEVVVVVHRSRPILSAWVLSVALLFCLLFSSFSLGRQNAFTLYKVGCNGFRETAAVAMLYKNNDAVVSALMDYLGGVEGNMRQPIDIELDAWLMGQRRWSRPPQPSCVYAPSLFQHIGVWSSISHKASLENERWRLIQWKTSSTWQRVFRDRMINRE